MQSILDAATFLLKEDIEGEEWQQGKATVKESYARPRTRQALTPATNDFYRGALHVGFSGLERTLHLHGRGGTPWNIKDEEGRRIEDTEFQGLFTTFSYLGSDD